MLSNNVFIPLLLWFSLPLVVAATSSSSLPPPPLLPPSSRPICAGSRLPVMLGEALAFCRNYSSDALSCCDAVDDTELKGQFQVMNISDAAEAAIAQSRLCAHLTADEVKASARASFFNLPPTSKFPIFAGGALPQPHPSCVPTSPLHRPARRRPKCKPTLSSADLSGTADPAQGSRSYSGAASASLGPALHRRSSTTGAPPPPVPTSICLERIAAGVTYHGLAPHPDGSGRAFLSTRDGKIWLASIPALGSGAALQINGRPFLDLTDQVYYDAAQGLGLMGIALHPGFAANGHFFVSYVRDSSSDDDSSPSAAGNGSRTYRYQLVVAKFSSEGDDSKAEPSELGRVFTMDLPVGAAFYNQHRGQILFPPIDGGDGYLYLIVGDGDVSEDQTSFYGKIIRFNVDGRTLNPEIFAMGLTNPTGCSFDSERASDLYCTNVDEVYLISSEAGNQSSKAAVSCVINKGRPPAGRMPSIGGGFVYRGSTDPLLKGRYVYTYGSAAWAALVTPESSWALDVACSPGSPVACGGGLVVGDRVEFGEDNSKDVFLLAADGVYRVIDPGACAGGGHRRPNNNNKQQAYSWWKTRAFAWLVPVAAVAMALAVYLLYQIISGGGIQITATFILRCADIMCCSSVAPNDDNAGSSAASSSSQQGPEANV
ncbi:hypothetical protein ACP4OV_022801 [Aristida adscensionis]